ncbi:MAG TPA: hypothetical protein VF530_00025 [Planctomycetota bacterium]
MRAGKALLAWLVPGLMLAAVLVGVLLVRGGSSAWFGAVALALGIVPAGWVLVSALFPARAERRCPACGQDALARRSPDATHGLRCLACGWADETASAWLLAEEEGPLEHIVLAERGRTRREGHVDSPASRG